MYKFVCTISSNIVIVLTVALLFSQCVVHAEDLPLVQAQVRAGGSTEVPQYYSGTNCKSSWGGQTNAYYYVTMPPYNIPVRRRAYIANVKFTIQGQVVINQSYSDTSRFANDGGAIFDSTHFADGSVANLHVEITDNVGNVGIADSPAGTAFVYNKAFVLGNNTFGSLGTQAAIQIGQKALSMDYYVTSSDSRRNYNIVSLIPTYTMFYFSTHGNTSGLDDCYGTTTSSSEWISDIDISQAVAVKGMIPQYSFVHLDSCNSAGDITSVDYILSVAFGLPNRSADTAFLGWQTDILISQNNLDWTCRFWDCLNEGQSVYNSYLVAQAVGLKESLNNAENNNGSAIGQIQGDPSTKVHGVYGGWMQQWFLPY